jgi:hypothetical protein
MSDIKVSGKDKELISVLEDRERQSDNGTGIFVIGLLFLGKAVALWKEQFFAGVMIGIGITCWRWAYFESMKKKHATRDRLIILSKYYDGVTEKEISMYR